MRTERVRAALLRYEQKKKFALAHPLKAASLCKCEVLKGMIGYFCV